LVEARAVGTTQQKVTKTLVLVGLVAALHGMAPTGQLTALAHLVKETTEALVLQTAHLVVAVAVGLLLLVETLQTTAWVVLAGPVQTGNHLVRFTQAAVAVDRPVLPELLAAREEVALVGFKVLLLKYLELLVL
jgi:hypothetical protein